MLFNLFKKRQNPASLTDIGGDSPYLDKNAAVAVAEPPAEMEKAHDPLEDRPGLELKFSEGERIPWKGIWFRIAQVEKLQLTLVPESMTWKMTKKVQARKAARG